MTSLQKQIVRAVKAARAATSETERLVQDLTAVDVDEGLSLAEVYRLHVSAQLTLEARLKDMGLWTKELGKP